MLGNLGVSYFGRQIHVDSTWDDVAIDPNLFYNEKAVMAIC